MGFKISPFDAYDRAERQHDKYNRKNKTSGNKLPTLEEQIQRANELEELNRKKRIEDKKIEDSKKHFAPLYDAKLKYEQSLKKKP